MIATKRVLTSLYQYLVVREAQQADPKLKLHELYDLVHLEAGLYVSESVEGETVAALKKLDLPYDDILRTIRRRKTNLVKRHLNIAAQYIDNVGKGVFPYRTNRWDAA